MIHDESKDTRQRVLESAMAVLAEKPFRDAKVAEICRRAGANVASVNYYFGSKEQLYKEALAHAHTLTEQIFPVPDMNRMEPETWLAEFVAVMIDRIFCDNEGGWFSRMLFHAMSDPSPMFREVIQTTHLNEIQMLKQVVARMFHDPDPESVQVRLCVLSVMSQCMFLGYNRAARQAHFSGGDQKTRCRMLVEHITSFSLAGIRAGIAHSNGASSCVPHPYF